MKKIISVLIAISIVFSLSIAIADIPDIKSLTTDELYQLNREIIKEFGARKELPSFTAPLGYYEAGVDFPVGKYLVISPSVTYITLYASMEDYKNDKPLSRKTTLYDSDEGKIIEFTEGMVVLIDMSSARFEPYKGLVFE